MKRTLAIVLLLALSPAAAPAVARTHRPTIAEKIHAAKIKAEQLQHRLHEKRLELNLATNKVNDLVGQLDQTNAAIGEVRARIGQLDANERGTQARLAWNTVQLRAAQRSLDLQDALLRRRLVSIYENGDIQYLNVLLSAHSFSEFVERWEDLRLLIAANQQTVRARKATAKRVAGIQSALLATAQALARQRQQQAQAQTQLSALSSERGELVAVAAQQRHGVAVQVAMIEDLTAAQEAQLEALITQRERELAAAQASQRRAAGIAGVIAPPNSGAPSALSWPLSGPITSPFGWRHISGRAPDFHPGLDIGVNVGTTVAAASSGTVIMAQWYGGYGNYVLIDHGGGISTGYGHLSQIFVTVGQVVQRGQAIAASGNTGDSTGPHLHFEVRKHGKPIDPAPWLH
ncbi:MAG TPA: peptidoglycan DD-metalloendopeptidase family protein [Candidatus Baltobacteraceae bacterium]